MAEEVKSPTEHAPFRGPSAMTPTQASSALAERWRVDPSEGESASEGDSDVTLHEAGDDPTGIEHEVSGESSDDGAAGDVEEGADGWGSAFTADDLAASMGLDKNGLYSNFRTQVRGEDGEPVDVTLHELVQGYQRGNRHNESMAEVEQAQAQLEQAQAQAQQEWGRRFQALQQSTAVNAAFLEDQEKAVDEHFKGLDWTRMRTESPGDFAALQADWDRAKANIRQQREKLAGEYQEAVQQAQAQQAETQKKYLARQRQALVKLRPEWRDDEARTAAGEAIGEYLATTYGVTPEEVAALTDARLLDVVWKAKLFDEAKQGSSKVAEKVKQNGGLVRPGAGKRVSGGRPQLTRRAQGSRERLSKTHKQAHGAQALADRWAAQGRNQP